MSKAAAIGAAFEFLFVAAGVTFGVLCVLPTFINSFLLKAIPLAAAVAYMGRLSYFLIKGQTITDKVDKYVLVERDLRPDRNNYLSLLPKDIWNTVSAKAARADGYRTTVYHTRRSTFKENLNLGLDVSRSQKSGWFMAAGVAFLVLGVTRYIHFGLVAILKFAWSAFK